MTAGSWRRSPWVPVAMAIGVVMAALVAEDLGARQLNQLLLRAPGIDKVLHLIQSGAIFLALYALLGRTGISTGARLGLAATGALSAALFDEFQQQWAAGRSVEAADIAAGMSGVIAAAGLLAARSRPRLALTAVACGLTIGAAVTYRSYSLTRDYNEGLLAEHEGRLGDARRAYLRALDRGVSNAEIYNALAWATLESGEGDAAQAVEFAARSLALRPGDPDTLDTYGWALFKAGRAAVAVAPLEAALKAKPEIYCIHYHLGSVYLDLGRREEGLRGLRLQVERMPGTREATRSAEMLARLTAPSAGGVQ